MAMALAQAGAKVLLAQRDIRDTGLRDEINAHVPQERLSTIYEADLAKRPSVETLVSRIEADGHRITILVNSAGVISRYSCTDFPSDEWDKVLEVNLSSTFILCRDVARHMLGNEIVRRQRGSIINVGSVMSFQGGINVSAYASSKGGLVQLTKSFSNELASKGIRVNTIAPGYCVTEMNTQLLENKERLKSISERIPIGRWGDPSDFAG
ncbi:hypothetical protein B0A52_09638 [Exophiala mesophila]|uniref:Uncharacterized protein n=1 Tax=Exophiala mesophila TaxID=212818 RepID=A0A438MRW6_EXOME|nr:hypothetical protein B0A52_09638 [Exophiala mesophila]